MKAATEAQTVVFDTSDICCIYLFRVIWFFIAVRKGGRYEIRRLNK